MLVPKTNFRRSADAVLGTHRLVDGPAKDRQCTRVHNWKESRAKRVGTLFVTKMHRVPRRPIQEGCAGCSAKRRGSLLDGQLDSSPSEYKRSKRMLREVGGCDGRSVL